MYGAGRRLIQRSQEPSVECSSVEEIGQFMSSLGRFFLLIIYMYFSWQRATDYTVDHPTVKEGSSINIVRINYSMN